MEVALDLSPLNPGCRLPAAIFYFSERTSDPKGQEPDSGTWFRFVGFKE